MVIRARDPGPGPGRGLDDEAAAVPDGLRGVELPVRAARRADGGEAGLARPCGGKPLALRCGAGKARGASPQ